MNEKNENIVLKKSVFKTMYRISLALLFIFLIGIFFTIFSLGPLFLVIVILEKEELWESLLYLGLIFLIFAYPIVTIGNKISIYKHLLMAQKVFLNNNLIYVIDGIISRNRSTRTSSIVILYKVDSIKQKHTSWVIEGKGVKFDKEQIEMYKYYDKIVNPPTTNTTNNIENVCVRINRSYNRMEREKLLSALNNLIHSNSL